MGIEDDVNAIGANEDASEGPMRTDQDRVVRLFKQMDAAWTNFTDSFAGLSDAALNVSGVTGAWSVKDIMAHLTVWENEALSHLPVIAQGSRPPTYAARYGGIDAFNAKMEQEWRRRALTDVRRQLFETHGQLIAYLRSVPPELLDSRSRFRRRLRLDTYGHYPIHTAQIRRWRDETRAAGA